MGIPDSSLKSDAEKEPWRKAGCEVISGDGEPADRGCVWDWRSFNGENYVRQEFTAIPKSTKFDDAILGQQDSFGLDITVNDAALVGVLQNRGVLCRIVHPQLLANGSPSDPGTKRTSGDIFHHEPRPACGFTEVIHDRNVRVSQSGRGLRLA